MIVIMIMQNIIMDYWFRVNWESLFDLSNVDYSIFIVLLSLYHIRFVSITYQETIDMVYMQVKRIVRYVPAETQETQTLCFINHWP